MWKSDDTNTVTKPNRNEKSNTSDGNSSAAVNDYYQNLLRNAFKSL